MAFLDFNGLSHFLNKLDNKFASKKSFTRSADGLVPHPTTNTSTKFLREDGTWQEPVDKFITTSDIDSMFDGTYTASKEVTKVVGDTEVAYTIDRIKEL